MVCLSELNQDPNNIAYWCSHCKLRSNCHLLPQDVLSNRFYASCFGRHYTNIMSRYSYSLNYGNIVKDDFSFNAWRVPLDLDRFVDVSFNTDDVKRSFGHVLVRGSDVDHGRCDRVARYCIVGSFSKCNDEKKSVVFDDPLVHGRGNTVFCGLRNTLSFNLG